MNRPARAACVIGWPAKQSRSPRLHGYWLRRYGIDGDYRIEEQPPEAFAAFVADLAAHGYVGANVTMPHKDAAFALSQPDDRARAVGAANTLWLEGDTLRSTNTDVEGFVDALDAMAPGWDRTTRSAVILGAGGTGRAIAYGFLERGLGEIHVVNRTLAKAEEIRARFGSAIHPASWEDLPRLLRDTRLLANATSVGMIGKDRMAFDLSPMPEGSVVADAVNVPLVTPLLAAAEQRGFRTSNGLEMLLRQAVRGFQLWFGVRPEVTDELRQLIAADIPPR
jgi:shikimate dehydrogenase